MFQACTYSSCSQESADDLFECEMCGKNLHLTRTCQRVFFRCGRCGLNFSIETLIPNMSEAVAQAMEEALAYVRVDRL